MTKTKRSFVAFRSCFVLRTSFVIRISCFLVYGVPVERGSLDCPVAVRAAHQRRHCPLS